MELDRSSARLSTPHSIIRGLEQLGWHEAVQIGIIGLLLHPGTLNLDPGSETPLYRQLSDAITRLIRTSALGPGDRLPATRELAAQLGLNRTTVSAAYSLLEQSGQIEGQVGRGSFVAAQDRKAPARSGPDWSALLPPLEGERKAQRNNIAISFASSSPGDDQLPLSQFRRIAKQVLDSPDAAGVLHLGSSLGYGPLRQYLSKAAADEGVATAVADDLLITNGCQQALDLLARLFAGPGTTVLTEDPVYRGLLRVFSRSGAEIVGVPVDDGGMDVNALESALQRHRPRLLVVTPNFQNPTGTTLPLERRERIVALANRFGCVLVENDIYSELRYSGSAQPTLRQLDPTGSVILLRSYSKIGFPGLRIGWIIAPRPVIACLAEVKETSDLHTGQLAQAVLLRFAESGELTRHLAHLKRSGGERLQAVLNACALYLPSSAHYTRPEGGLNLWLELPAPLDSETVLRRAQEAGVTFSAGPYFSQRRSHRRALRLSFGGLTPEQILRGMHILGEVVARELAAETAAGPDLEPAVALV